MAVIVEDNFTELSDTDLASHTPSPTGTGWTEEVNDTTASDFVVFEATDLLGIDVTQGSRQIIMTAQPDPTNNEYDVEVDLTIIDATGSDDPSILIGRLTASNTMYGGFSVNTGVGTDTHKLFKIIAGSVTELASTTSNMSDGDVMKLEIRDATKKLFKQGSELISSADNVITLAGKAGIAVGDVFVPGHDVSLEWRWDNFKVTEVAADGGTLTINVADCVSQETCLV